MSRGHRVTEAARILIEASPSCEAFVARAEGMLVFPTIKLCHIRSWNGRDRATRYHLFTREKRRFLVVGRFQTRFCLPYGQFVTSRSFSTLYCFSWNAKETWGEGRSFRRSCCLGEDTGPNAVPTYRARLPCRIYQGRYTFIIEDFRLLLVSNCARLLMNDTCRGNVEGLLFQYLVNAHTESTPTTTTCLQHRVIPQEDRSKWSHYLRLLPSIAEMSRYHPLFFDDQTVYLLEGSHLKGAVERYRSSTVSEFRWKFVKDSSVGSEMKVGVMCGQGRGRV